MDSKKLWLKTKKLVREYENGEVRPVFDDTIIEKPYMDGNGIICWNRDRKKGQNVKGINLLSCFYVSVGGDKALRAPIGYEIITKTETYRAPKDGTERRRSAAARNELMRK